MSDPIESFIQKMAAQRYVAALSVAAGANERIAELEKALETSEWGRLQAESVACAVTYPEEIGHVWHVATEPPPDDCDALLDLTSGTPWVRVPNSQTDWRRFGTGTYATRYEWPIEDGGPFIALPYAFGLHETCRTLDKVIEDHDQIHRLLYGREGYSSEGERFWTRPGLHQAVGRVIAHLDRELSRANAWCQTCGHPAKWHHPGCTSEAKHPTECACVAFVAPTPYEIATERTDS